MFSPACAYEERLLDQTDDDANTIHLETVEPVARLLTLALDLEGKRFELLLRPAAPCC
jgi:hypothetical protein